MHPFGGGVVTINDHNKWWAGYDLYVNGKAYATGTWGGSDRRWKKNIRPVANALDKVSKLRGVTYEWKTEEYPKMGFSGGRQLGLVAQEVEEVIPEAVNTDNAGYKAIAYGKLAAVLVEAVKEQQQTIKRLEARLDALSSRCR